MTRHGDCAAVTAAGLQGTYRHPGEVEGQVDGVQRKGCSLQAHCIHIHVAWHTADWQQPAHRER